MAEKDKEKATARTGARAKATAKPAAKAAAKTAAKPAERKTKAPARRAVARPVTRVVRAREAEPVRPQAEEKRAAPPAPKPREVRALPTAPTGRAPLIAADGTSSESVELPAALAQPAPRRGVLYQALVAALANARQATSATRNRARVSGGGAKPWRQKGTGRARQGSTRSPHWRHGGVVFGPNGRRYEQRIPAKMRRAAFAQAIAAHAANGRVFVLDDLIFDSVDGDRPRTRDIAGWLTRLGDAGRAVLVTAQPDDRVGTAAANLRTLDVRTPTTLRLADVLRAETLLVHRPALETLAARATVGEAR